MPDARVATLWSALRSLAYQTRPNPCADLPLSSAAKREVATVRKQQSRFRLCQRGMKLYRAFAPAPWSPALRAVTNGNRARSRGLRLKPLAMRPGAVVGLPRANGPELAHLPQAPPPPALPSCPQQAALWTTLAASGSCDSRESRPSVRCRGFVETATQPARPVSPEPAHLCRRPAARFRSTRPSRQAPSTAARPCAIPPRQSCRVAQP